MFSFSDAQTRLMPRLTSLGVAAVVMLAAGPAYAADVNPYALANNTWITLNGSVENVKPDTFTLDYGDGKITVEMDDGDRDADAYKLIPGDKVTVTGKVDDDFLELRTIEASSVFVENLNTTFFASAVDEETSEGLAAVVTTPIVMSEAVVTGTVTGVDQHEFSIDTGMRKLNVDVASMPFNPLDDEGFLKIDVGDRVKVRGQIDHDLFDGYEIDAEYVVKLHSS